MVGPCSYWSTVCLCCSMFESLPPKAIHSLLVIESLNFSFQATACWDIQWSVSAEHLCIYSEIFASATEKAVIENEVWRLLKNRWYLLSAWIHDLISSINQKKLHTDYFWWPIIGDISSDLPSETWNFFNRYLVWLMDRASVPSVILHSWRFNTFPGTWSLISHFPAEHFQIYLFSLALPTQDAVQIAQLSFLLTEGAI